MMDGGVRRGTDVFKALALGAKFVFVGRPFGFAAAIGGEEGVSHAIRPLSDEVHRDMALLGITSLAELTPSRIVLVKGDRHGDACACHETPSSKSASFSRCRSGHELVKKAGVDLATPAPYQALAADEHDYGRDRSHSRPSEKTMTLPLYASAADMVDVCWLSVIRRASASPLRLVLGTVF